MTQVFDVERALAQLTLEEKASLTSGSDFWHTTAVERVGIPAVMVSDGPHGLRKQSDNPDHLGLGESVPATCFPTAAALGSSWDADLLTRVGEALGRETRANDVAVLLGPGVNLKRTPLCGRNFEYVSEDPVVAGVLGAALVRGIQSQGVGTSLKHYAANNQESDRMRVSAEVDERTLREIYLPAFERVVKDAQPWTVMCAYNKVNGTYASQNHWLLTEILRDEWAFEGLVVSDWGAVHDRVPALAAGLDLQMPGAGPGPDDEIVAAVRDGSLDESVLDASVRRVLRLVARGLPAVSSAASFDVDAHHDLAREAAAAGSVLLKNEGALLPLPSTDGVAVVGEFARTPRYQGAGSSQVNPTRLDAALDALRSVGDDVPFAAGFTIPGGPAGDDDDLLAEAVSVARDAGTVVAFVGLPAPDESEGYDRPRFELPDNQVALLRAVAAVNPRVVVVLANGSAVGVSGWHDLVPAILETWLGGQAGGSAVADLLLGIRTPSGRLAETIPHRIEDTPAFGNFPGEAGVVRYGEGVLVGYRWYDTRAMDVAYPFGHGLSYTTFSYDSLDATVDGSDVTVTVTVTNTGPVAGAEVVQVYLRDPRAAVLRPTRELKAFAKVALEPGESREVAFALTARDLSYWHPGLRRWVVEGGEFVVEAGASSRDIRGSVSLHVEGEPLWSPLTSMSTIEEWFAHPVGGPLMQAALVPPADLPLDDTMAAMMLQMPAKVIAEFGIPGFDRARLDALVAQAAAS
ncbi:beta-glucosidase [Cellulomonas fengjieae]|uniref:Glycoside hydrolase family 3 C-terminal domain-containing protein n=1 Tax=Cellulomonas fengjieae TaxID=2819978 RepID=A0ABS3SI16_9CELL|nr:glycoside hydrolase family 3 C-terminal domain-containing protein [Cellulomonas fengjieae]MBO3085139.1 glycoside hydrolase family 3 C-terminal domain-containing protein [Cellulomonas fengjieae]QVI66284.1 glycoside hydrolase family 3 C-terminal domain-containing protein [Cellulomonas fengjieae]